MSAAARPGVMRRLQDGSCSEITEGWKGRTVVCIASGPSLTPEQVALTRGAVDVDGQPVVVAVINDNYRLAPWADLLYFADDKWWQWHRNDPAFKAFAGEKVTLLLSGSNTLPPEKQGIHGPRIGHNEGLSNKPQALNTGSNSGHQLINLAVLAGAARILLLGYDGRRGPGGQRHHRMVGTDGNHPDKSEPPYGIVLRNMATIAPVARAMGIEIINCSPGSAIDCFTTGRIEDWLHHDENSVLPDPAPTLVSA